MGRRSRKRSVATTRAAARPAPPTAETAPPRPRRRSRLDDAPPAPWGSFPLAELCVFLALVIGVIGLITWGRSGQIMLAAATALGSLAGLEVAIREHFAGYRSHTLVLAGACAVATVAVLLIAGAPQPVGLAVGIAVMVSAFVGFRNAFRRRSGGLSFR
jgi:hypothetical protein